MRGATEITLPFPPSVNALFVNRRGGRARTKAYDAWIVEAGTQLLTQRPMKHEGPVTVAITVGLPDKRNRDLDNLLKPLLDLLVRHQVIQDDSVKYLKAISIGIDDSEWKGAAIEIISAEEAGYDS